ncbi:MAG TPA: hypothetical protein PLB88_04685 [Thermoanaerobaculaceae bacterium]|nr:hypothetical protein [Thermoanaerobaculaceae bacterium]
MPTASHPLAAFTITGVIPRSLDAPLHYAKRAPVARHYDKSEGGGNCGDGKGGFQKGNRCGKSQGGGTATAARPRTKAASSQGMLFGHGPESSTKAPSKSQPRFAKLKAVRPADMAEARRVGTGKDAKVLLANGQEAPAHIKPSDIPPDWQNVRVSLDPNSDVKVTARDSKGRTKSVYRDEYHMATAAAKFARIREASQQSALMARQIQEHRRSADPATRENADLAFLIKEQGTRPGSEDDTKGLAHLYGKPVNPGDVEAIAPAEGAKGKTKVFLHLTHEGQRHAIPIKDEGTAGELLRRSQAGEDLHDSTYWLKSHGASTLEGRHVVPTPEGVRLQFVGKEGVWHNHLVRNPELARMLTARKGKVKPNGQLFNTNETKLNGFIKGLDGGGFSAKDFRTLRATRLAHSLVAKEGACCADPKQYKSRVMEVARKVSRVLGNQPAEALKNYIDPTVFSGWRASHES